MLKIMESLRNIKIYEKQISDYDHLQNVTELSQKFQLPVLSFYLGMYCTATLEEVIKSMKKMKRHYQLIFEALLTAFIIYHHVLFLKAGYDPNNFPIPKLGEIFVIIPNNFSVSKPVLNITHILRFIIINKFIVIIHD